MTDKQYDPDPDGLDIIVGAAKTLAWLALIIGGVCFCADGADNAPWAPRPSVAGALVQLPIIYYIKPLLSAI